MSHFARREEGALGSGNEPDPSDVVELDELLLPAADPGPAPADGLPASPAPAPAARLPAPPPFAPAKLLPADPEPTASPPLAKLAARRIHPVIAAGIIAIAALVAWLAYLEVVLPSRAPPPPPTAAVGIPPVSLPAPRAAVAPAAPAPAASSAPVPRTRPAGDELLYAARPLAWWNDRLSALAAQEGEEARRLRALTLRRAESLGLRAPPGGGPLAAPAPAEAK